MVLLQLEIPLETVIRTAEIAKEHGAAVVLNPAPACRLPKSLLGMVDYLTPNETETELLTGLPVKNVKVHVSAATVPDSSSSRIYDQCYAEYRRLYPALKASFAALSDIR